MRKGLLWAGLVIAGRQFVAVIIVVLSVMWLQPSLLSDAGIISAPAPEVEANQKKPHALLGLTVALADLLVATGLIATSNGTIEVTARSIKRAALVRQPTNPQSVIDQLVWVTGMAALGCIVMLFSAPPSGLFSTTPSWLRIAWAGFFSVAFAFFAATTRAALMSQGSPSA